jgi:hypothetical protein
MLSFGEKPLVRRNSTQIAALKETNAPPEYFKNKVPQILAKNTFAIQHLIHYQTMKMDALIIAFLSSFLQNR